METSQDSKPPVFNKWSSWYWLVTVVMVIQLVVYLIITLSFS